MIFTCESSCTGWMRTAVCTWYPYSSAEEPTVPVLHCVEWDSCGQMPKTLLWYDKMNIGMQLRPQNQGTKGHRHTVGRRISSPVMICLKKTTFLHLQSDHLNNLSVENKYSLISWKTAALHKHAGEMSLRHISRGRWRTFSWSTTRNEEEDVQYGGGEERPGRHAYSQASLSGHSTTGQRFVTDRGLLPHPLYF